VDESRILLSVLTEVALSLALRIASLLSVIVQLSCSNEVNNIKTMVGLHKDLDTGSYQLHGQVELEACSENERAFYSLCMCRQPTTNDDSGKIIEEFLVVWKVGSLSSSTRSENSSTLSRCTYDDRKILEIKNRIASFR
jgi:hypothetical protein